MWKGVSFFFFAPEAAILFLVRCRGLGVVYMIQHLHLGRALAEACHAALAVEVHGLAAVSYTHLTLPTFLRVPTAGVRAPSVKNHRGHKSYMIIRDL